MKYKFCKKRRLFLKQTSASLGLFSAAQLLSLNSFAQTSSIKKNVIFVFFNHSANIPFGDYDKTFHKGGWTFGSGSSINAMNSIAGDSLFIRGVRGTGSITADNHSENSYSCFTAAPRGKAKSGIDVVLGEKLQEKHGSNTGHWSLGFNMHHGDGKSRNFSTDPLWRTTTFKDGRFVIPETSVDSAFKKMQSNLNCTNIDDNQTSKEQQKAKLNLDIKKLNIVKENYIKYKSSYLIDKVELEKIEQQIAKKIEQNNNLISEINNNTNNPLADLCKNMKNPKSSYTFVDNIKPELNKNLRDESYSNFHNKSLAFFDLITLAFKMNYTRSITYHTNIWQNNHHGDGAHKFINNGVILSYLNELSRTLNVLFDKLKKAGLYDETLVVLTGEFAHQNNGRDAINTHRGDNLPWMIVNSGKNGDINLKRKVHPGDIHCNIANRMGVPLSVFGENHPQMGNRKGNYNDKFFT